jgi:hypothetical protein
MTVFEMFFISFLNHDIIKFDTFQQQNCTRVLNEVVSVCIKRKRLR